MTEPKLLKAENLSVYFKTEEGKEIEAVQNINFEIQCGEVLGIVGESGSGKSVTALSLMCLYSDKAVRYSGNAVFYDNGTEIPLTKLSAKELQQYRGAKTAMIFQEPMTSLNPAFTVGEQVAEAIRFHQNIKQKEAYSKVIQLFEEVLLPRPNQLYNAYPHELSGGQKQRVMIAMALSGNPKLLIADEPTTALDVTVQKSIIALLKKLKQERNTAMLFISHDLALVSEISDSILVMHRGKAVEYGKKEQVLHHPNHPYTKGLLACRPAENLQQNRLPTLADFINIDANGNYTEAIKQNSTYNPKRSLPAIDSKYPVLKVENLKVWFPLKTNFFGKTTEWVKAVDDVSFEVYQGEILGIVGESGCGKSTIGKTLMRLIKPTDGSIIYNSLKLSILSKEKMRSLRKDIQLIFQDPYSALNPRMTIGAAIMEPMRVHNIGQNRVEREARVIELLQKTGLPASCFNRFPHEFSGGQRQRICIARALALEPKFLIFDESVSALDVSVQSQILNLLLDLRDEFKLTYIFISHDLAVIRFLADRILVMNKGRIEETGTAAQIYEQPQKEYTKKLIEAIPKLI